MQVGARVARIERDRALEEQRRAVERLLALGLEVEQALGEGLVGREAVRLLGPGGAGRQLLSQAVDELGHQAVLQLEDRLTRAVDLRGARARGRSRSR